MAEVLSLSVQSSSPISMMHTRPTSSDAYQGVSQQYTSQTARSAGPPRVVYNGQATGYRGTSAAPIPAFAFSSTPGLRQEARSGSSSSLTVMSRHAHTQSASASSTSTESSQPSVKDDSVMGSQNGSLINLSTSVPDLALTSPLEQSNLKPSPDRYRRPGQKRTDSSSSTSKVAPLPTVRPVSPLSTPTLITTESAEDISANTAVSKPNRYRRRSLNSLETQHFTVTEPPRPSTGDRPSATSTPTTIRPPSLLQDGSSGLATREDTTLNSAKNAKSAIVIQAEQKTVNIPPRGSSTLR